MVIRSPRKQQKEHFRHVLDSRPQAVIDAFMSLPPADRLMVAIAIEASMADAGVEHGPADPSDQVARAWSEEIECRLGELHSGTASTVTAEVAELRIKQGGGA